METAPGHSPVFPVVLRPETALNPSAMPNPSLPARALLGAIRLYQATLSPVLPALLGPS